MICQLVNGDYLSIMREKHLAMDCRWDEKHGIGVAMPQKNVIIKRGVNDFNVNVNSLSRKSDGTVMEKANGLEGVAIPRSKSDRGRGQLRRSELFPNRSRHHTGGCPLVNDAPGNVNVSDFH